MAINTILNNYLDTDKAAIPIWGICACFIALEYKLNEGVAKENEIVI